MQIILTEEEHNRLVEKDTVMKVLRQALEGARCEGISDRAYKEIVKAFKMVANDIGEWLDAP